MSTPVVLGTSKQEQQVCLDAWSRLRSTYVLGIQGTGKTTLLLRLALGDIASGNGLCIITPHGDLIRDVLARIPPERAQDVIVFDPSVGDRPFGLHVFECADPSDDLLVNRTGHDVVQKTFKLVWADSWGPQMDQVLRICCLTITRCQSMPLAKRPTLVELSQLLRDKEFRQPYIDHLRTHYPHQTARLIEWWEAFERKTRSEQADEIRSTLNKTDRFAEQPTLANMFGQPMSSFNFRQIMDEGKILLVDLTKGKLGLDDSSLLGAILVGQFYLAALSRDALPETERRPFHLIVDEFQNFANDSFFELHEEARKYAVDTVIAHQNLSQLAHTMQDRALGAGNKIVFKVSGLDAQRLALEFDATPPAPIVVGERPVRTLSATAWSDLKRGGGLSSEMAALVSEISWRFDSYTPRENPAYYLNNTERALNAYLHERMQGKPCGSLYHTGQQLWVLLPKYERIWELPVYIFEGVEFLFREPGLSLEYAALYATFGAAWERRPQLHSIPSFLDSAYQYFRHDITTCDYEKRFQTIRRWLSQYKNHRRYADALSYCASPRSTQQSELHILEEWYKTNRARAAQTEEMIIPIKALGDLLEKMPIYAPSLHTEPIYEKPRTFDDVRSENANALARQKPFHAWIVLANGTEYRDVQMEAAPAEMAGWQERVSVIEQSSQLEYGRERDAVEKILSQRRSPARTNHRPTRPLPDDSDDGFSDDEEYVDKLNE